MPSTEKVERSKLVRTIDSFLEKRSRAGRDDPNDPEFLTIIEFIERFKLLPYGLYPAQKFILKLYYNLPLDDIKKIIIIRDSFTNKVINEFTEVEYLEYLYSEGRCNLRKQDSKKRYELILVLGRRSGKSVLAALIAAYELYKLLRRGNPQAYYGIPSGSQIRVFCIANDKDQASIVYDDISGYVGQVDYFKTALTHDTQTFMKFQTDNDKKVYGEGIGKKATITATFKSSIAKGLRGRGTIAIILDELAYFVDDGKCVKEGTLVFTDRGVVPIEELGDPKGEEWQDCSVTVAQEGQKTHANTSKFYVNGCQPTRVITTRCGYEICGTFNHKIRVLSNEGNIIWRSLDEIEEGDFIGINRSADLWAASYVRTKRFVEECSIPKLCRNAAYNKEKFVAWLVSLSTPTVMSRKNLALKLGMTHKQLNRIVYSLGKKYHFRRCVRTLVLGGKITEWIPSNIPFDKFGFYERKKINLPEILDDKWGLLLGILVGDGTWALKNGIQITGGCEEFRRFIGEFIDSLFGYHYLYRKTHRLSTCPKYPWGVKVNSTVVREFLEFLGYDYSLPQNKRVPWSILKSPRSVVSSFLRGFFETDGGLEQNGRTISASTASKRLASEIQLLLLNFGITSSVYHKWNNKYCRFYYIIRIIGFKSRRIFYDQIGFISQRKQNLLIAGINKGRDTSNIVPNQYNRLCRLIKSIPYSDGRSSLVKICAGSVDPKRRGNITYLALQKVITQAKKVGANSSIIEQLEYLDTTNYFWDPVGKINDGKDLVYDLTVPDGESFVANGITNHNSSAERVYKALTPSISQFSPKDSQNKHIPIGPPEGRVISISSPDAKEGFFYHLYQLSLSRSKASTNMVMIQAPTWEINPTLSSEYYEVEYAKDPGSFWTEHGAKFSDRVRGWIEDKKDLLDCVIEEACPLSRGRPREFFWAGVDFGISRDGTAIALSRINAGKVELGYHEVWYAGVRWKESNPHLIAPLIPYAYRLQDVRRIDIDEIVEWFLALSKRFYILSGVFDQWAGPVFEQKLHKAKLTQFEMRNFSAAESSQAYQTTKMMMFAQQLALYDYPLPKSIVESKDRLHSPLIEEMLELQARSGGKNIIVVEAPNVPGKHDDVSDAIVRSILLISEYIKEHPDILEFNSVKLALQKQQLRRSGYRQFHRNRIRFHGPPPRERFMPIFMKK